MKGISLTICVGKSGGLHANITDMAWRVCFYVISFTLYFCDIEAMMEKIINENKKINESNMTRHVTI